MSLLQASLPALRPVADADSFLALLPSAASVEPYCLCFQARVALLTGSELSLSTCECSYVRII